MTEILFQDVSDVIRVYAGIMDELQVGQCDDVIIYEVDEETGRRSFMRACRPSRDTLTLDMCTDEDCYPLAEFTLDQSFIV